jgi:hypothetical protein
MSYMVLNHMFHGVRPISNISKLAPFYYGGFPLGPLSGILSGVNCHKDEPECATIIVPTVIEKPVVEKEVVVKPKYRWLPPTLFFGAYLSRFMENPSSFRSGRNMPIANGRRRTLSDRR